jgi:acyl-CoA thioesterase-1
MRNLMLICPMFFFLSFISCGDAAQKKKENEVEEEISSEKVATVEDETKTILFFGNSLTAGMGLDPNEAFPALIQEKIDSLDLNYEVINAGLSGETTAGGRNRIDWVLNQNVDVFILELGANDGLRGVPLEETRRNLQAIIDIVRKENPDIKIILAGMQIPPNLGQEYAAEFRNIFPELAEENNVALIPFLLEDVAGNPELNQQDGIHPTAEGQKTLAQNVWEVLKPEITE